METRNKKHKALVANSKLSKQQSKLKPDILIQTLTDCLEGIHDVVEICLSYGYYHHSPVWTDLRYIALFIRYWIDGFDSLQHLHEHQWGWFKFAQYNMKFDEQAKRNKWKISGDTYRNFYKGEKFKLFYKDHRVMHNALDTNEHKFIQLYEDNMELDLLNFKLLSQHTINIIFQYTH